MKEHRFDLAIALLALIALLSAAGFVALGREDLARIGAETRSSARAIGPEDKAKVQAKPEPPAAWRIAAKFGRQGTAKAERGAAAPKPVSPQQKGDWLRPVGGFEDSQGKAWVFLKDDRSGRILKLRLDGTATEDGRIAESSQEAYFVEINAASYSLRRK